MRCDVHTSSVVSRWVIPSICSFFPFPVMPHFVESGVSLVVSFMFGSSLSSRGLDFRGCVEFSKAMRAVQDARTNRRYYYLGRESKSTAEALRFRLLHAASKGDGASKEAGGPPRPGRADEALREELWPSAAATLSNDGGANRLSRTGGDVRSAAALCYTTHYAMPPPAPYYLPESDRNAHWAVPQSGGGSDVTAQFAWRPSTASFRDMGKVAHGTRVHDLLTHLCQQAELERLLDGGARPPWRQSRPTQAPPTAASAAVPGGDGPSGVRPASAMVARASSASHQTRMRRRLAARRHDQQRLQDAVHPNAVAVYY